MTRARTIAACERSVMTEMHARCPDEFAHARYKATPATKAAAAAEWAAMDWRGNLPVGWVNPVSDRTLIQGEAA